MRPDLSEKEKLLRVSFANELVLYSLGIPFFHAGQEIGLSKKGEGNTYNAGDSLNQFKYSLLKERSFMLDAFKKAVDNSEISMDRIEESVYRILKLKQKYQNKSSQ